MRTLEFIHITDAEDFRAKEIYTSYCETFPEDERRCESQFQDLFSNPCVKVVSVLDDLQTVGYLIIWELSDSVFIEHFEIFSEYRSMKYGSEIIREILKEHSNIILEAEPENLDQEAASRLQFYKKNGFTIVDETYMQPSYGEGKKSLNLWLLCNKSPECTDRMKEEIYDVVYRKL